MKTRSKFFWLVLLMIAIILFLIGLNTGNYIFNVLTILLSFFIYKHGYQVLFKEYDDSQREKRETAEKIYSALQEGKKRGKKKNG